MAGRWNGAGVSGRLAGRVCVVTGATGIAEAAALRFAREGARVFVVSRDAGDCRRLAAAVLEAGGACAWAAADLRDEDATAQAFAGCLDEYGHIDGLFAVAGASGRDAGDGPAHGVALAGWDETLQRNLTPAFLAARQAVRVMLDQQPATDGTRGAVAVVTSVLGWHPSPRLFATHAYAASKGATASLVRAMAAFYAPHGIRINAVAPGLVATPMARRAAADPATVAYARARQPLTGGFVAAGDVAGVALFLLSDDARAVTGQVLAVDGGWAVSDAGQGV